MGDMVETFKAMNQRKKEVRAERAAKNIAKLQDTKLPFYEQGKNVWRLDTPSGAVMFYPASGKWQHNGRTFAGTLQNLESWLKNKRILANS